jgi:hypothetical protein
VFYPATDIAIGIHTTGGCETVKYNSGTGFKNSSLESAIQSFPPGPITTYLDGGHPPGIAEDGSVFKPFRTIAAAIAGAKPHDTISIVTDSYAGGGITFPMGKPLSLRAPVGPVRIGPTPPPQ